jgi:bifunctional non-homologous end joining protein LigD
MPARMSRPAKSISGPPAFTPLLLPSLVETPPAADGWLHEIKHDGFRTALAIGGGRAIAYTRFSGALQTTLGALED